MSEENQAGVPVPPQPILQETPVQSPAGQQPAATPPSAPVEGSGGASGAPPEVPVPVPVEADAAKPGPEPTASESSGTGDQAGGAIEQVPAQPVPPSAPPATADAPVEAPVEKPVVPQNGVCVDGVVYRGRDDDDVLTGFFCQVVGGEHQGRYGVYIGTATLGPDEWPQTVTIRTRDDRDEYLTVAYSDIRPAQSGGR